LTATFVLVTGTSTGVGKTWVACALARELVKAHRVVAIKPIETGGGDDGEMLAKATGQSSPVKALVELREPLTPALAADREGVTLDFDAIVSAVKGAAKGADVAIVEGAGGLLSPITWDSDATTLARALDAKVILVASDALGTISAVHTAAACFPPFVIALVEPASRDASTGTNADALRRRLGAVRIVEIARNGDVSALAKVITSGA
jgi:dethiobiotin synthetase